MAMCANPWMSPRSFELFSLMPGFSMSSILVSFLFSKFKKYELNGCLLLSYRWLAVRLKYFV